MARKTEITKIEELDPFFNVRPTDPSGSSGKVARCGFSGSLDTIKENDVCDNVGVIHGTTYCRIVYANTYVIDWSSTTFVMEIQSVDYFNDSQNKFLCIERIQHLKYIISTYSIL